MKSTKETKLGEEHSIRKDERKKMRRKKRGKGMLYMALILIILILILLGNGYLGLFPFGVYEQGDGPQKVTVSDTETESDQSDATLNQKIIVEGDQITYEGDVYDLDTIIQALQEIKDKDQTIDLVDKYATAKTFDLLVNLIKDMGTKYNIVEDY